VFLDDPSSLNSKAIVCRNSIKMNINSHQSNMFDVTLQDDPSSMTLRAIEEETESLSSTSAVFALTSTEVLMVPDMACWHPYQILHPTNINVIVSMNEKYAPLMDSADELGIFHDADGDADDDTERAGSTTSISLEITDMLVRISLNDLLLIHNILLRRTLVESITTPGPAATPVPDDALIEDEPPLEAAVDLSHFYVASTLQHMSFILINDFDPSDIMPIARCKVSDFSLTAKGQPFNPEGEGLRGRTKMLMQLDSRNHQVAAWEPIIEPWEPTATFVKKMAAVDVNVVTRHTFQITLTSTFLETFSKTYAILHTYMPEEDTEEENHEGREGEGGGGEAGDHQSLKRKNAASEEWDGEDTPQSAASSSSSSLSLTVVNKLGVPIDIYTRSSGSSDKSGNVWHLSPSAPSCRITPPLTGTTKASSDASTSPRTSAHAETLSAFDFLDLCVLMDQEEEGVDSSLPAAAVQKEPLRGLPTFRSTSKVYRLWNEKKTTRRESADTWRVAEGGSGQGQGQGQSEEGGGGGSRVVTVDEELFEYQRYVIGFGRKWKGKSVFCSEIFRFSTVKLLLRMKIVCLVQCVYKM
jgi:hypothetical protein